MKRCGIGVGIGRAVAAVLLLGLSALAAGMDDPRAFSEIFGILAFFGGALGCALGGALSGEETRVACAGACCGIYCAVNLALSFAFREGDARPLYQVIVMYGAALALSLGVGLLIGRRSSGSRSVRKKLKRKMAGR